jgi:hypothetical protein
MRTRAQTYNRSLALCLCVETLAQQFEELRQLRNLLRWAEAKAIGASRYQRSCRRGKRTHCGSLRRRGRRVR